MKHMNPQFGLWDADEAELPNRYPNARPTLDAKIEMEWRRKYQYRRRPTYINKFLNVRTLKGFQRKRKIRENKKYWRKIELETVMDIKMDRQLHRMKEGD